jgi:POT family proton-dependent oligopeptide transporter
MFKGHPKGLLVAAIANMGERFGFYTMMAILVLFLQTKYGLSEKDAGDIYSWFYFGIYALALIGGIAADMTKKYKSIIFAGIVFMLAGYIILFMPGMSLTITVLGLFVIAFGNGLFKGNLQAVVGQLYDDPKYSKLRDSAFMLFYMGINVGAFFAPFAATGIRNWWLESNGFHHDGSLPALCHQVLNGSLTKLDEFLVLANKASIAGGITDAKAFAAQYIDVFSRGYNFAFGIAAISMVISLVVYILFNKALPNKEKADKDKAANPAAQEAKMPWSEEKPRLVALGLVFAVVIFFWMSFHQNGLTLTFFARDYVAKTVDSFTYLFFELKSILAVILTIGGLFMVLGKDKSSTQKGIGAAMTLIFGGAAYYFMSQNATTNAISPEVFQSFNPLFIVALTPIVMGVFAMMAKKGTEPSTPKKIGFGMVIAAIGFCVVLMASMGLVSPHDVKASGLTDYARVTPYWLISSYLILTVAELFLSPMGLSFVSKVAPPRFQGLMQSGWLLATAVGNKLLVVGSIFWGQLELWQLWAIFIVCCLLSASFIFSIMKKLEKVS